MPGVGNIKACSGTKNAAMSAFITRKDGTVESLGVVAFYSRNPLRVFKFWLLRKLGRKVTEAQLFR